MRRLSTILCAVAVVLSGCAGQASLLSPSPKAPSPNVTESPSAPPSLGASPSATVAPSASAAVTALPESGQHVYPGTYTTNFQPPLTLTVGRQVELGCAPGFKCRGDVDVNKPGWIDIEFGSAPAVEVHLARLDKVTDPEHPGKLIDPPLDLARWVAMLPGITLTARPRNVQVGGIDATQLDIQSEEKDVVFGAISKDSVPDEPDAPTSFGIGPHAPARVIVMKVGGHVVVIQIDTIENDGALAAAVDALQPLVDSIVWQ